MVYVEGIIETDMIRNSFRIDADNMREMMNEVVNLTKIEMTRSIDVNVVFIASNTINEDNFLSILHSRL